MCCGTEAGSHLRIIDSCNTQLTAQGPSRTCDESKDEEEEVYVGDALVLFDTFCRYLRILVYLAMYKITIKDTRI